MDLYKMVEVLDKMFLVCIIFLISRKVLKILSLEEKNLYF